MTVSCSGRPWPHVAIQGHQQPCSHSRAFAAVRLPQVRSHLIADPDIRFGVFLSGGVDSSILAAILVDMGVPVQAFTVGMDDSRETDYVGHTDSNFWAAL